MAEMEGAGQHTSCHDAVVLVAIHSGHGTEMHASHITVALYIGSRLAVFLSIAHGGHRDGAGLHNDRLANVVAVGSKR
jgi:hypothetical protein